MKKTTIIAAIVLMFAGLTQAQQKYGYVNFGNILQLMPQIEKAESTLSSYSDSLFNAFDVQKKEFEKNFADFQNKVAQGLIAPVERSEEQAALQQKQQELIQVRTGIQQKIQQKRTALMTPIINQVQEAINAVGEEGGYTMIFDTSLGAILHADSAQDLNNKVKAKLHITE